MEKEANNTNKETGKKKKYKLLRILGRVVLVILFLFLALVIFIRSPWGQGIIVNRVVSYVSNKTHTKIEIDKLFLTFSGNLQVDGLFLEDKQGDTLIYSKSLEANIPLWSMINGEGMGVDALNLEGVRANIIRKDSISGYNFQFLIDAFVTKDPNATQADSTAAPLKTVIGDLNFKDINVVYNDAVVGIESHFVVDELHANMETTDLKAMIFKASDISMSNAKIKFIQKPVQIDPNAEVIPLPYLSSDKIALKNVFVNYESYANRIAAEFDISDLFAEIPRADFANDDFDITEFNLKNSIVTIHTETENNAVTQKVEEVVTQAKEDIQNFEWPEIKINIKNLNLENNRISYFVRDAKAKPGKFNPNAIALNELNLIANSILIKDKKAGFVIEESSFKETSGFNLKKLSLQFDASDSELTMTDLQLVLNDNKIQGQLKMEYSALSSFIESPETSKIALNVPSFQINLKEVFKIQPELRKNEYLSTLSKRYLTGNLVASGYLSSVSIPKMTVNWGNSTHLSANGTLQNTTNLEQLKFNIPNFSVKTIRADALQFVNESELGVSLPETISLSGKLQGSKTDIYTKANLTTSQGIANIDGHFKNDGRLAFDADISIENYKLNELLQNDQLGALSLTIKTNGEGADINHLNAKIEANVSKFTLKSYDISDLKIKGDIKDGTGTISSQYNDKNLNLDLNSTVVLDSIAPEATVELDIIGADLQGLGLIGRDVRTGMKLYADFKGNLENYDVSAIIDDGVIVYDDNTYLLGSFSALAHVKQDTTSISVKNKVIDILLESNTDPLTFSKALQRHISSYFYGDQKVSDTILNPVNLKLKGHISQAPILNEVFLVNVKDLDTIKFDVDFNEKERKLKADVTAPHINYSGYELDSLRFSMDTDKDNFKFDLGFKEIQAGPFDIQRTEITGLQSNSELSLGFLAYHKEEKMIQIQSKISGSRDRLVWHVDPEGLILNSQPWNTPTDNEIVYTDKKLAFNNFIFSRNKQSVEITDKLPTISKDHIAIDFQNFKLNEFLSYLNPDKKMATGNLNGDLVLEEPFADTGILADLLISELSLLDVDLGTLTVDAKSIGGDRYDFNADMNGGDINLDLVGDYLASETGAKLNLDLKINEFKMKALNGFTQGKITDTDGSFSGDFTLNGTLLEPIYKGKINFKDADFKVAMLNTGFTLTNETLNISNEGITLQNFTVRDENQNSFVASGKIGTESFLNPTFDLNLTAKNFQVLNAKKEDNDYMYGKLTFDAKAAISGDLQIPIIDMDLQVGPDTNVTYILPSATVNIEERDGVVIFVNRENPDAILTRTEEKTAAVKGFDISALLKVGKGAAVTIIIDEETGDNFKVSGKGDFNFTMNPNGRMNLAGTYDVTSGHYEMNLYNIVNRKFEIAEGSRVTWSGDPFDAKLDIKAIYKLETSASSLMAPASSGSDPSIKGKYRQVLPFYVYLNIEGELMKPKISFNLDMPEDEQGAIGGQVYGRVQQVNQQEDELNRQVFSLLVLNRFYPDPGSDGSAGGVASIARDNLNDALSDQLNLFSDKLFGKTGFEVDFGLDSFTDYQGDSPQDRTQLDIAAQKKLFNDRLIVRVGSEVDLQGSSATGEAAPLIGNVSLEYILTENGRYRIKGFRRNEFENVIDGQTIVSGIALIFTQEFNKFSELWDALVKAESKSEKAEKEKLKKAEEDLKAKNEAVDESMKSKQN